MTNTVIESINFWNNEYLKEVKKSTILENKIEEVNKICLSENATNEEKMMLEKIKTILKIELKTNKEIEYPSIGSMKKVVIPKGAKVEKNEISTSGYFLSPDNFDKNSMEYHDAKHYGFVVNKLDIEQVF